jgi:dTDP-4-amino-4,6-dideoxygalactose transaminase
VIEDCAQALGSEYKGEKVGSIGKAGCLSFFPANSLGAYGDAGMVVTNDEEIAKRVRTLRFHGSDIPYNYVTDGFNSRLDALQAAILRVKLGHLGEWISLRNEKAIIYNRLLEGVSGIDAPYKQEETRHSYNYYTICISGEKLNRDELKNHLKTQGIQAVIFYPSCLHLQQPYRHLKVKKNEFKVGEWIQDMVLSLPLYPELTEKQIKQIVGEIRSYIRSVVDSKKVKQ